MKDEQVNWNLHQFKLIAVTWGGTEEPENDSNKKINVMKQNTESKLPVTRHIDKMNQS